MDNTPQDCLSRLFAGETLDRPPIWLMRQAGRYLPEYREIRAKAGSFLNLCYNPALACEVTMQPIHRFDFDAAILFADILVIPDALGQDVTFVESEGPQLDAIGDREGIDKLDATAIDETLAPVYESVHRIRVELAPEKSLIGFCGAPWTVASYMIAGKGTPDQAPARFFAYRHPEDFAHLMDILVEATTAYLLGQVHAGANVVQIFDSWAGNLPDTEFRRWVIAPTKKIVDALKAHHPHLPVIGFPRDAGAMTATYIEETGVGGVGCDTSTPLSQMFGELADKAVVQGCLDPLLLVTGGDSLDARAREIVEAGLGRRFIFNLGHGVLPSTVPDNVARLVAAVRSAAQ